MSASRCSRAPLWRGALLLTLVLAAQRVAQCVTPEAKLQMMLTALSAESLCFAASDMGVQRFEWNASVSNPVYPFSPKSFKVRVLMYIKYTHWRGAVQVKGFVVADTKDAARPADGVPLAPTFTLSTRDAPAQSFTVPCQVHSYWDPPKQAAMVYGFEHSMPLDPANTRHEYQLSSTLDKSRTYAWRPLKVLNHMDGRGAEVPPVAPGPSQQQRHSKRQAYVVLKPLYNFSPNIYTPLIQRHMEYYQALGVDKHIIYLRRESIPVLLGSPKIARAAQMGRLIVVEWDGLEEHVVWHRQYDQRVIYSHATLVFTNMDVYLLNIDLDEYLVTNRPELQDKNLQEIVETCTGGPAVDVRIQRHHVVCKACNRDRPEATLWADEQEAPQHPLSWYHLVNLKDLPKRRSVVNPNFMHAYYIHHGALKAGVNASFPDASCLSLLHMPNLLRVRDEADLVEANYVEDHAWMGMLRRLKSTAASPPPLASSTQTAAAGAPAAAASAPAAAGAAAAAAPQSGPVRQRRRLHGSAAWPEAEEGVRQYAGGGAWEEEEGDACGMAVMASGLGGATTLEQAVLCAEQQWRRRLQHQRRELQQQLLLQGAGAGEGVEAPAAGRKSSGERGRAGGQGHWRGEHVPALTASAGVESVAAAAGSGESARVAVRRADGLSWLLRTGGAGSSSSSSGSHQHASRS